MKHQYVDFQLNTLLGLEQLPDHATTLKRKEKEPNVPKLNPKFVFMVDRVRLMDGFVNLPGTDGLLICGPKGCGKSIAIHNFFAAINTPYYFHSGHEDMIFDDLVGTKEIIDGDTVAIDGPLTKAIKKGCPFVLHELDRCRPEVSVALNSLLDGYPLINSLTGESIEINKGFKFLATANSNGLGDLTGEYLSAKGMDQSTIDRLLIDEWTYYPKDVEIEIIRNELGNTAPDVLIETIVDFANTLRFALKKDALNEPVSVSIRSTIRILRALFAYQNHEDHVHYAIKIGFANGLPPAQRIAALKIADLLLEDGVMKSFAQGGQSSDDSEVQAA